MKINYHTHHELCGHAGGTCEDYVKEALVQSFTELGFSDHAPFDKYNLGFRMNDADLDEYLRDIETVQKTYGDRLTIKKGIEAEYWYTEGEYLQELRSKLDYMILGQHFISMTFDDTDLISTFALSMPEHLDVYATYLCDAMQSGHYDMIAHPDLYMHGYLNFDEHAKRAAHKICSCAEATAVILEFNANGYRRARVDTPQGRVHPYPRTEFWDIAEQYEVRTILNSDCHSPGHLYDDTIRAAEEAYQFRSMIKITTWSEINRNSR